jgi:hypothetical protein
MCDDIVHIIPLLLRKQSRHARTGLYYVSNRRSFKLTGAFDYGKIFFRVLLLDSFITPSDFRNSHI